NAYVKNLTEDTLVYKWRNLSTDTSQNPADWVLVGVCDNNGCYAEYGFWYYGDTVTSGPAAPGNVMNMIAHGVAPTNAADGVGINKTDSSTANQVATSVFKLPNRPVGVDRILVRDNRVNLYPNPANREITPYVDRNLKASRVAIFNIVD